MIAGTLSVWIIRPCFRQPVIVLVPIPGIVHATGQGISLGRIDGRLARLGGAVGRPVKTAAIEEHHKAAFVGEHGDKVNLGLGGQPPASGGITVFLVGGAFVDGASMFLVRAEFSAG